MSLLYIGQLITIYCGFILLFTGIIGNGLNVFIFSSVQNYRRIPCTFYFVVEAIFNILELSINLTSRIVSAGYGIDLTRTSVIWCKTRYFFFGFFAIISFSCSCLATVDQFFVTSPSPHLRQLSKIQWAHRIVFGLIIFGFLLSMATNFAFFNISPTINACAPVNTAYALYVQLFTLIGLGSIPILIMFVFGCLTYRNIRQTRTLLEQHADRQLVKMILIQAILVVISVTPYGINGIYDLATAGIVKNEDRQEKESFVTAVVAVLAYSYYAVLLFTFLLHNSLFLKLFLGKFLHILDIIESISTDSNRANLLFANTK
jgi:hypothetical protein